MASYGLSQSETRFSPLNQINTTNVSRLGLSWSYVLGAGGGNQEATPLVWRDTIFGITNWSVVFALDARTGKEVWRWDPEVNQDAVRPKICCGAVNRGLAIYDGRIFAPVIDGRLVALDAATGRVLWEARIAYSQEWYAVTMAPRVAVHLFDPRCPRLHWELQWHYRVVPNDNWDYDSVQQLTLANLTIDGRPRKVLMQASKNGFFYVFDRTTGEFISAKPFTPPAAPQKEIH